MKFIVEKDGTFYNAELAGLLEIDDPQTSIYLGNLTRKLRAMALSVRDLEEPTGTARSAARVGR